jgi:hypothetical protein
VLELLGFGAEIILFAAVGVAAFRLVGAGPDGVVVAASAVVAAVIVWAVVMAPGASHRLPAVGRAAVVVLAGGMSTALLASTGGWRWSALAGVATVALVVTATRPAGEPAPEHLSRHGHRR